MDFEQSAHVGPEKQRSYTQMAAFIAFTVLAFILCMFGAQTAFAVSAQNGKGLTLSAMTSSSDEDQEFLDYPVDLSRAKIVLDRNAFTYNGESQFPFVQSASVDGIELDEEKYEIIYSSGSSAAAGTYEISIVGLDEDYVGTAKATYSIAAINANKANVILKTNTKVFTGKALKCGIEDVKLGAQILQPNIDYEVSYSNNKAVGKATVTVMFKGNYAGKISKTFTIKPAPVKGLKLTRAKKAFNVKWTKAASANATGYQLRYASSKSRLSKAKPVRISTYKTVKKKISKLKSKKTYYVQMRIYKKVGKTTYYSAWTTSKKIKTK